jgi:peptidoglycan/LPS O-acetylase OafA/YrhL
VRLEHFGEAGWAREPIVFGAFVDWRAKASEAACEAGAYPTIMNPPTWSLASEVQFYLMLPFLVRFRWLKYALLPLSYAVFVAASFGFLQTVTWGYKLLPGTLFLFILGSALYEMQTDKSVRSRAIIIGMAAIGAVHLVALSVVAQGKYMSAFYSLEVLVGMLAGMLCLYTLGAAKPAHRGLDNWLGKLSYPIFLTHIVVLYGFDHLRVQGLLAPPLRGAVALQLVASVVIALPLVYFDDFFQRVRKRLQGWRWRNPAVPVAPAEAPVAA